MAGSKQGETKAVTLEAPSLNAADQLQAAPGPLRPAPVHLWDPALCGSVDIVIARDGAWYHEGGPITRPALARLFASVLRREVDGSYVLVTPHEKLTITVEDAPFLAVDLLDDVSSDPPVLRFVTNLGEVVPLDADHPLRLREGGADDPFVPYLTVRPGLEARLTRPVAADLAARAEYRAGRVGVASAGQFFVIGGAGTVGDA